MNQTNTDSKSSPTSLKQFITDNKNTALLFLTRLCTIICGMCAVLPILSGSTHPAVWYYRGHMAAAVTSVLRLWELLQVERHTLGFNRATLTAVLAKDACHYLIFTVMFLSANPITISIIPIILFALLHSCSFLVKLLQLSTVNLGLLKMAIAKIIANQVFLLQVIAINEIMLMPVIITSVLTGGGNIFLPFVYYRFICLRYSSSRNPYTRTVFAHLRLSVEQLAANANCPSLISTVLLKVRDLVTRLCPQ